MPFDDIAPDIQEFVDKYIDCFVAWDILSYFHENPDIERKLSGIALDIGRRVSTIEPSLDELVEQGVLARDMETGDEPSFSYTASAEFKMKMDRFLTATRDRTNRLAIVSKVLQKEAKRL